MKTTILSMIILSIGCTSQPDPSLPWATIAPPEFAEGDCDPSESRPVTACEWRSKFDDLIEFEVTAIESVSSPVWLSGERVDPATCTSLSDGAWLAG